MFVKQIDLKTALELAAKGIEIPVMAPDVPEPVKWTDYSPDTLQNMLAGVLFFRREPAMEKEIIQPPPNAGKGTSRDTSLEDRAAMGSGPKRAKKVDEGKLLALHKAGWSQKKIADELKVAPSTVCAYLKQMEESGK